MKTEQLLAGVLAAAEHLDEFDRDWFDRTTAASLKKDTYGTLGEILGVLAVNLRENLREEEAKRAGGSARLRAMKRIAANMEGVKRPWYNGTLSTKDGSRAVCDNFRAVRIADPSLPMPAEAAEKPAEPWDLLACYEKPEDLSPAVNAPNTAELRAMIREKRGQYHGRPGKKSTFRADYRLGGGLCQRRVSAGHAGGAAGRRREGGSAEDRPVLRCGRRRPSLRPAAERRDREAGPRPRRLPPELLTPKGQKPGPGITPRPLLYPSSPSSGTYSKRSPG